MLVSLVLLAPATSRAANCVDYADYIHWVGGEPTWDPGLHVVLSGDLAFVPVYWGSYTVRIIDVSDPSHPRTLSSLDTGSPIGCDVEGDLLYVANGDRGLAIANVTDPSNPYLVSTIETPGEAYNVVVHAGLAYVADRLAGLQIIDVSSPSTPFIVGSVSTSGDAVDLVVDGMHAYVANRFEGLRVVDVSNPGTPVVVGALDTPGESRGIAIRGPLVYLADGEPGIQIIDVARPATPALITTVDTPGAPYGIEVEGRRAYVADFGAGLTVLDLGNLPASARVVTTFPFVGEARDVAARDGLAFVSGSDGLQIVDASNPAFAPILGSHAMPTPHDLVRRSDFAYAACGAAGLQVLDVSNPAAPRTVGAVPIPGTALRLVVSGAHAYIAAGEAGLQVVDISDPETPLIVASAEIPYYSFKSLVMAGNHLYVHTETAPWYHDGVVIDVTNPLTPVVGDHFAPYTRELATSNGHLSATFEWEMSNGVRIYDVSQPAFPESVGELPVEGIQDLAARGDLLLTTSWITGLQMLDLSDAENPALIGTAPLRSGADQVVLDGDFAYLDAGPVQVVDLSNPAAPAHRGSASVSGDPWVIGDVLYVATPSGIAILPKQCPAGVTAGVGSSTSLQPGQLAAISARPNPAHGSTTVQFSMPSETAATLSIHDATGRLVRRLTEARPWVGTNAVGWDGTDDGGRTVSSGVYFARLSWPGGGTSVRVVLLR